MLSEGRLAAVYLDDLLPDVDDEIVIVDPLYHQAVSIGGEQRGAGVAYCRNRYHGEGEQGGQQD